MSGIRERVDAQPGRTRGRLALLAPVVAALVLFVALDLALGSVLIPPGATGRILLRAAGLPIAPPEAPSAHAWETIILLIRLPKALTALLAGAALAVCGLIMQTLFRNPLADPFVLGISSGASLGAALVVLAAGAVFLGSSGLGGQLGLVLASGAGAAAVLLLVLVYSRRVASVMTLLILGLLFGYAVSAVVSILVQFSAAERVQAYVAWTFGSFAGVTWQQMPVFAAVVAAGVVAAGFFAKPLNALLLGEHYAQSMGLHVRRMRTLLIVLTALLAGSVTAFCGPIAFVGVAIPHFARSLFATSNHRTLLPAAALLGALTTVAADLISHVPGSQLVLPLNAVTSLIGVPVIVAVILRRRDLKESFAS